MRQELGNFGKRQSIWGHFMFPKRVNFHLRYVLGESIYQFQSTTLQIVFIWTPLAHSMPKDVSTYAEPWRRASRLARGWAPWTCWASSAAHQWCRPGSPGLLAWTWPWAGWRWWCWAPKWRPWGTRRRWKCWPVGRRDVAQSRDGKGQQSRRLWFFFSKQQRNSPQWKSLPFSYSAGFWRLIAQREKSKTTDIYSFTWVKIQRGQIHLHPIMLSSPFQCSSLP